MGVTTLEPTSQESGSGRACGLNRHRDTNGAENERGGATTGLSESENLLMRMSLLKAPTGIDTTTRVASIPFSLDQT